MYRGPSYGGRSKATANTLCQKCLQRDIYECKVSAQERPYKPRPSRTQQLMNPHLKPKLTTEVPNELLRKKGVADDLLAKKAQEREGGNRCDNSRQAGKRGRSMSSSDDSVSTISTNRSPSHSRSPDRRERSEKPAMRGVARKRGRRSISASNSSHSSQDMRGSIERNTRRRMSSFSPARRGRSRGRGRPRSRSRSRQRRRRFSVSRSRSRSSDRMDISDERPPPRSNGISGPSKPTKAPSLSRSRSRSAQGTKHAWRSRSRSPFRSARSPSPYSRKHRPQSPRPFRHSNGDRNRDGAFNAGSREVEESRSVMSPPAPPPRKERSLSPYSRRVAMTQAMQAGR